MPPQISLQKKKIFFYSIPFLFLNLKLRAEKVAPLILETKEERAIFERGESWPSDFDPSHLFTRISNPE